MNCIRMQCTTTDMIYKRVRDNYVFIYILLWCIEDYASIHQIENFVVQPRLHLQAKYPKESLSVSCMFSILNWISAKRAYTIVPHSKFDWKYWRKYNVNSILEGSISNFFIKKLKLRNPTLATISVFIGGLIFTYIN